MRVFACLGIVTTRIIALAIKLVRRRGRKFRVITVRGASIGTLEAVAADYSGMSRHARVQKSKAESKSFRSSADRMMHSCQIIPPDGLEFSGQYPRQPVFTTQSPYQRGEGRRQLWRPVNQRAKLCVPKTPQQRGTCSPSLVLRSNVRRSHSAPSVRVVSLTSLTRGAITKQPPNIFISSFAHL